MSVRYSRGSRVASNGIVQPALVGAKKSSLRGEKHVATKTPIRGEKCIAAWFVLLVSCQGSCVTDCVVGSDWRKNSGAQEEIRLLFAYGSEKETWVREATGAFHATKPHLDSGEEIVVDHRPAGSNVLITEALEGKTKADIISPASQIFLVIANGIATDQFNQPPLVNLQEIQELVRSPLVVAIWTEMATKIGWDNKPPGWRDVFKFVDPSLWERYRMQKWGSFKYGHTHPDYSNSGLLARMAEVYAGLNKYDPDKISLRELNSPELVSYLQRVERGVIHYGESTVFFAKKMFDPKSGGPKFLSASILYENLVFEANKKAHDANPASYGGPKVMAIYPAEGTFANEHPVAMVERPSWVTPKHRAAAKKYIDFLRSDAIQKRGSSSASDPRSRASR